MSWFYNGSSLLYVSAPPAVPPRVTDKDGHVSCLLLKPQSHIHDFGPGRATVHPELSSR